MGIRGLTSYISQNSHKFYEHFQLCDCTLVIDGCSLACQLYIQASDCMPAFGGDYDAYAKKIEGFFSVLEKCHVTPVVVIDGGYEGRKLNTILSRFKEKITAAKICNPTNQNRNVVFPLLVMEVFKQTLMKMNVKFVQTDFEADHEIAVIARNLQSPVLSNDSDFYIYDVLYIPFPTLNPSPFKMEQDSSVRFYLSCEMYKVERLVSGFGGFDKRLLPLLSILLGNDYVGSSVFNKFVEQIMLSKYKKTSPKHGKLASIFEWLKAETLESATGKMLNHVKKKQRNFVKLQIELAVSANSCINSEFTSYLGLETKRLELVNITSNKYEKSISDSSEGSDDSDCDEDAKHDSQVAHPPSSLFPSWLQEKFRKGELSTCMSDIFHMHLYFCHPQVEDFTCNDAHGLSFPILKIIFGLLTHCESLEGRNGTLTCYSRGAGGSCQTFELQPTRELPGVSPFPSILTLFSLPLAERKQIFFSSLGITDREDIDLLDSFSDDWKLFASVVVFWARSATFPEITPHYLHSLIICMIALGVVDKKVGRIRDQKHITVRKAHASRDATFKKSESCNQNSSSCVPESECLKLAESLLQFHQFRSKQFSRQIVHVFAQFQACLSMIMSLNSLLEFPVPQCQLSEIFSGSLLYSVCVNLKMRKDVGAYINFLMSGTPSLYELYKGLLHKFTSLLPHKLGICKKAKQKTKTKSHRPAKEQGDHSSSKMVPKLENSNKFSLLNVE